MTSQLVIKRNNSETAIVSFGGSANMFGGIQPFEFMKFLNGKFSNYDQYFFIDKYRIWYHKGIEGISNDIDETVDYLKSCLNNYKNIIFLGVSAGGYASILFGSLLNVNKVVAFIPQTIVYGDNIDVKYGNINQYINDKTKYYIYGDTSLTSNCDLHHISHCENISNHQNVFLDKRNGINMHYLRDSGELLKIFNDIISQN